MAMGLTDNNDAEVFISAWSTSQPNEVSDIATTSLACAKHISLFFQDAPTLAIATEASSHPSGLLAVLWQPWHWAGSGLGNIEECSLQTCIAGARFGRDSFIFGSLCIVPECTAKDLVAQDFNAILEQASLSSADMTLGAEYKNLLERMTNLNQFLGTGWSCGDFVVPWAPWPLGCLFIALASAMLVGVLIGSLCRFKEKRFEDGVNADRSETLSLVENFRHEKKQDGSNHSNSFMPNENSTANLTAENEMFRFWLSFDVFQNMNELCCQKSKDTAMLDGLRVGSICWVILGHTMAIAGSVTGFSNPSELFPPSGYLSSLPGQLVFSSKFGVDTFLTISGFLTFHVLSRKIPRDHDSKFYLYRFINNYPKLILARLVRIIPLYFMVLLFYVEIAPHLGGGPLWYQWQTLLQPCRDYGWTNLLFVNNFVPLGIPTAGTCFYHSWYLAVDMQLFLLSSVLVFVHQSKPIYGKIATMLSWLLLWGVATYLAAVRHWSANTFDGAAVGRYDVEAYANPFVRAQTYLTGIYVAMLLPKSVLEQRHVYGWRHRAIEALALAGIALVTFITYLGANSRRPCQYQEWPLENNCGSEWTYTENWIYTSMSRTIWCISVGTLMHLFIGRSPEVSITNAILSSRYWAPLSRLSFAVYLIHPILIFIWELGASEKQVFRPMTFGMKVISICVVSYMIGLFVSLIIEMPAANLWKAYTSRMLRSSVPHGSLTRPDRGRESGNKEDQNVNYWSIKSPALDPGTVVVEEAGALVV